MSNKVIVYSKLNCPNCEHVKWGLDAQEVPYEVRMIEMPTVLPDSIDAVELMERVILDNRAEFDKYGFMAAPVTVFPNGKVMDGFHHGKFVDRMREMGYDV